MRMLLHIKEEKRKKEVNMLPDKNEDMLLKIEHEYSLFEKSLKEQGLGIVWETEKGIYGAEKCRRLFDFFSKINLKKYKRFLDIGSGDGRAVLIASLFTDAEGIEIDANLADAGVKIRDRLGISEKKCRFICGDFLDPKTIDFGSFDFLFINPDQGWHKGLEDKLLKEMKDSAVLFVNNNIFLPDKLKKGKSWWLEDKPVIEYRKR